NPSLNVWRGNPAPPSDNTSGQFGDPRASWYISDAWPAANYLTNSYWGGPPPVTSSSPGSSQFAPLTGPDAGHNPAAPGATPSGLGQNPINAAKTAPTPNPTKWISK